MISSSAAGAPHVLSAVVVTHHVLQAESDTGRGGHVTFHRPHNSSNGFFERMRAVATVSGCIKFRLKRVFARTRSL